MKNFDPSDLKSTIDYQYGRVRDAIERDWTGTNLPVSLLDKQFLRLTEDTLDDGVLMNETVFVEDSGPALENNLETVPPRYGNKLMFQQLLQSRLMKCKSQRFCHFTVI